MRPLDIRLKLILIVIVSALVFWAGNLILTSALLSTVLLMWFLSGLTIKDLNQVLKIKWFILAVVFFHSYFSFERDLLLFTFFDWGFSVSKKGLELGLLMGSNVFLMVLITALVRKTSQPMEVIKGLQQLGLSIDQATVLDATMELVEHQRERKKKKSNKGEKPKGKRKLGDIIKGKIEFLIDQVNEQMSDAKEKFKSSQLAITVTFTGIISAIRFIKIAPGLPIAPGHKNILIMPLFINAAIISDKRFTATNIGFLSGLINFLAGFGKYGPLGPLQFMVPGLVIDLLKPIYNKTNSIVIFGLVGFLAGASRVAAEITLAYLVGMPQEFYLVYLPFIIAQCSFGLLSAPVTRLLSNNINRV